MRRPVSVLGQRANAVKAQITVDQAREKSAKTAIRSLADPVSKEEAKVCAWYCV